MDFVGPVALEKNEKIGPGCEDIKRPMTFLLMTQGDNRVELRGLPRRIEAEKNAYAAGK